MSARTVELTTEEKELIKDVYLLTSKPILYIANVSEEQLADSDNDENVNKVREYGQQYPLPSSDSLLTMLQAWHSHY